MRANIIILWYKKLNLFIFFHHYFFLFKKNYKDDFFTIKSPELISLIMMFSLSKKG